MAEDGFGWRALNWAWDRKDEIVRLLGGVRAWFRGEGKAHLPGILVIGPGGTGKTTLARLLAGETDWLLAPPSAYAPSANIEHHSLTDPPAEIVVPPSSSTVLCCGVILWRF